MIRRTSSGAGYAFARTMQGRMQHPAANDVLGRSQTCFERGVASMAAVHMRRVVDQLEGQGRPVPVSVSVAQRSRKKLLDISGDVPKEPDPMSTEEPSDHLRTVAKKVESATFTNDADRGAVAQMLFDLEWLLQAAIEEVLARRGGSARLTEPRRSGRQLWQRLRMTHQAARLLSVARIAEDHKAESNSSGSSDPERTSSRRRIARLWRHALATAGRVAWVEWLFDGRRRSGGSTGDGSGDLELMSRGGPA
jgi:hypothetical protein